jgi:transcriptional regulator with XRE-family HTH domain
MDREDPRRLLARRLRALREERWPGVKITQHQLARALGGAQPLSVPLISSWETQGNPKIPPISRLEAYATFFATERSVEGSEPRLLDSAELTDAERRVKEDLKRELMDLRKNALPVMAAGAPAVIGPEDSDFWRFEDGETITIICAQLPESMQEQMPYTKRSDPDYVALYTYADLDALFELHGHLRATNPRNQVNLRPANRLVADDYSSHLISLGGVDWNLATREVLNRLQLPVRQVGNWDSAEGAYFEVNQAGQEKRLLPQLDKTGDVGILLEDVAMFARAINPHNRDRTVTICNGMYGAGTNGAVRALTDARFRERNTEYLRERFADSKTFCLVSKVTVVNGTALTPDWTDDNVRLFEWPDTRP